MKNLKENAIKNNQESIMKSLLKVEDLISNKEQLELKDLDKDKTVIIFVDMVHGFVDEGILQSDRALTIKDRVKALDEASTGFHKVFFVDQHDEDAAEFNHYGKHCVEGSKESILIDDYDINGEYSSIINKNSVNGFVAPGFTKWLEEHPFVNSFIVVGLVTDICVMNFALTLKSYFNQKNIVSNIIIPTNCVETFDYEETAHNAALMNAFALYNMQMNGIELKIY